jgi:hypothetical protein
MSDREAKLAAFLAKDEPPTRDPLFEARLLMEMSRPSMAAAVLKMAPGIVTALVVAWAAAPGVVDYLAENAALWSVGFAFSVLASSFWLLRRQFVR